MKNTPHSVVCEDIEGNRYDVSSADLVFRPAVYGIIIKDDTILLSKQWDGYDFPGGGIELGENTEDAVVREVKEETGMEVQPTKIIYSNNSFFKLPFKGTFVHSIHLYYLCEITGGELSTEFFDENEVQYAEHPEWVQLNQVTKVKIYTSADVTKILEDFL